MRIPITTRFLFLIVAGLLALPSGYLAADELLEAEFKDLKVQFMRELKGGAESRSKTIDSLSNLGMSEVTKLLAKHFPKESKDDAVRQSKSISNGLAHTDNK